MQVTVVWKHKLIIILTSAPAKNSEAAGATCSEGDATLAAQAVMGMLSR